MNATGFDSPLPSALRTAASSRTCAHHAHATPVPASRPRLLALACALLCAPTLAYAQEDEASRSGRTHTAAQARTPVTASDRTHDPRASHDAHAKDAEHEKHNGHDHDSHDHDSVPKRGDDSRHGDHDAHDDDTDADPHAAHRGHEDASAKDELPADAAPHTPIPAVTDADRAAARGPMHADHRGHGENAHDRRVHRFLLVDRLETWDTDPGSGQAWEVAGWVGRDIDKFRLRSEGERKHGHTESADLELLYSRAIAPWWDLTAGVRHDFAPGASQDWAAVGVIGMAPYKFEVEATAYLGPSGRTAVRAEAEYSLLLSDRLILQPLIEAEWHGRSDASRGVGAGLGKVETGLRLRYEIRREFAPYLGVVHERAFGRSADFKRDEGEDTRDTRVVFGVRMWF